MSEHKLVPYTDRSLKLSLSAIRENIRIRKDKDYFRPDGIHVFYGEQGSGKTLTLIHIFKKLQKQYPRAVVISNIILNDMKMVKFTTRSDLRQKVTSPKFDTTKHYIFYSSKDQYEIIQTGVRNGKFGVILLTDEYQNYFSNQDSKNVPPWVLEQNAQNRKQRRIQLASSQDYDQVAKPTRRRTQTAYKCRTIGLPFTYGDYLTIYWLYNPKDLTFNENGGTNNVTPLTRFPKFYNHTQELRDSYDTYQVVFTGDSIEAENMPIIVNNLIAIKSKKTKPS